MSSNPNLKLDWCSHQAAKYACEHWHYSRSMPSGKMNYIGVWEREQFKGVIIFGRGSNNHIGSPYGLQQVEICELTRVALASHDAPVSRILSIATKILHRHSTGLRIIVSYADPEQNHLGVIYQAAGWTYVGLSAMQDKGARGLIVHGKRLHPRTVNARYGTANLEVIQASVDPSADYAPYYQKHKYLYPLDPSLKPLLASLAKPYPKRQAHEVL